MTVGSRLDEVLQFKNLIETYNLGELRLDEFKMLLQRLGCSIEETAWDNLLRGFSTNTKMSVDPIFEEVLRLEFEEDILFHFRSLSVAMKTRAVDMVCRLHRYEEAQENYKANLTPNDRETLSEILASCVGLECEDRGQFDLSEFKFLHTAVGQVLGYQGQATWEEAGSVCPADVKIAFKDADVDVSGKIDIAELGMWLRNIADKLPGGVDNFSEFLGKICLRCKAAREVDKFSKAYESIQSLAQYGVAFRKVRQDMNYQNVPSRVPPMSELRQPGIQGRPTTVDDLFRDGKPIMQHVANLGNEIRKSIGASFWSMGPLKGRSRAEEKIKHDYNGDACRLLDVVRLSIVCDNVGMVNKAIEILDSRDDVQIVRIKSSFDTKPDFAVASGGYRDVKVNVRHNSSGHLFEVQLHVLIFYSLKREGGHALYQWTRQFSVQGILSAGDVLERLSKGLLSEMLAVTREKLEVAILDHGLDSLPVMEMRVTMVQLAKISHDSNSLSEHANILLDQATNNSIVGATEHDVADILLLCGDSGNFDAEKSQHLIRKAKSIVSAGEGEGELCASEVLFLAKCNAAIGSLEWRKGILEEAAEHYRSAITSFKRAVDSTHPQLQGYMRNLGAILLKSGDVDEALHLLHQVEELTTHPVQKGKVRMELGNAYEAKCDWARACEYFKMTLEKRLSDFGDMHPAVANAYLPMGRCKAKAGMVTEALIYLQLALKIYTPLLKDAKGSNGEFLVKQHHETQKLVIELTG